MPTMLDVAKRANVALSTVSYALNGTRSISEKTRQRIFAAMEELGYRPHALARGLASKRSRIIALLFPYFGICGFDNHLTVAQPGILEPMSFPRRRESKRGRAGPASARST